MLIEILLRFVDALLRIYELLFLVRAVLSWIPPVQGTKIAFLLYSVTEPVLAPIRMVLHKIPFLAGFPIDFSMLVAYLLIDVVRTMIFQIL